MSLPKTHSAIQLTKGRVFNLEETSFTQLNLGSAVTIDGRTGHEKSPIFIHNNEFQTIYSYQDGGAISAIETDQISIQSNIFSDIANIKENGRGGAILYQSSSQIASLISGNHFIKCSSDYSGAIHWNLEEPKIEQNSFYQTKSKYYGDRIGSYGTDIQIIQDDIGQGLFYGECQSTMTEGRSCIEFKGLRSGGEIPYFYAAIVDQYHQVVTSMQGETIYTIPRQVLQEGEEQSSYLPLLSNFNNNIWRNGVIKIDKLQMIGEPGKSYEIEISTPIIDSELPAIKAILRQRTQKTVTAKILISFRLCERGEQFLPEGECRLCPQNTYLLHAPTSPTPCKICPENAVCFGGDKIGPQPGYWRSHQISQNFYPCFNEAACLGTSPNQDYNPSGTCREGYEGNLCGSCSHGYTRNAYYQCTKCPHPTVNFILTLLLLIFLAFIIIVSVKCSLKSALKKQSLFTVYFKILVNHLQILMLISSFDFDWPAQVSFISHTQVQGFLSTSQTLTDSPQQMFSIDCLVHGSVEAPMKRFYIYSLIYFFLPLIIALTAFLFWALKYLNRFRIVCRKFTATLLIVFFIIHPSITRVSLQLFDCSDIDGSSVMTEEPNQYCWKGEHLRYSLSIGMLGIILWSLGIPIFSCFILRRNRKNLEEPVVKEKLGFLYNGYTTRSYYWEVVMSGRKVIIAFVSIFLTSQGTITQSLVLFVVLVLSIFLNFKVNPFVKRNINRLEIVSLIALIITVYCGIFFLSARNPRKNEYIHGKDFALSPLKRWVLFLSIIISNGVFILLWIIRLINEVKSKLLERFPRFYRVIFLCCSRIKLSKEQSMQNTSEKNQELIHRIEQIKAKLSAYVSRLEGNEQILEQAPLQELVDGMSYGIRNLEKWKERKLNIDRQKNLRFKQSKGSSKHLRSDDMDLDTGMSTGRSTKRLRNEKFEDRIARQKKEFLKRFNSFKTPQRDLVTFFREDHQNQLEDRKEDHRLELSAIERELGLCVDSDNPSTDRGQTGARFNKRGKPPPSRFRLRISPMPSSVRETEGNYEEVLSESPRKPITASTQDQNKRTISTKAKQSYSLRLKRFPREESYSD